MRLFYRYENDHITSVDNFSALMGLMGDSCSVKKDGDFVGFYIQKDFTDFYRILIDFPAAF